jgi:hypothetical protein
MKRIMRCTIIPLLVLAFALGLALLLAVAGPAVAQPVSTSPLPPVERTDGRPGACFSYYPDPATGSGRPFVQMAWDAGSRWDRFDFAWRRLEPEEDDWDSEVLYGYDTLVDDLHDAGMNMVGILLWTPDWAATGGVTGLSLAGFDQRSPGWYAPEARDPLSPGAISAASSPPRGLYLPWNDPDNHWGDYVYTVVSRYGDRVKDWEMWNEPEWSYFWSGTSADYAQLLKVGYQATKAACPDCTVLFGGLHYWLNTSYYRWVLNTLSQDPDASQSNHFFDVMSVHLYSRSANTYDEVNNIRSGMSVYGVGDHPIWLTETGVPVWDDGSVDPDPTKYDYAATQDEAAAYVIQSYANAWASDVGRYFFFRVHDSDMGEYFGLIRNDRTLRPAYVAYQVATSYLISPTFVTRASAGPHMRVTLWGTPRGKVSVLWNESGTSGTYTLAAALDSATVVDRWGVTGTTAAIAGAYTVTLPGATANLFSDPNDHIIGGDPLLVVESETPNEPPTSTVHPLPPVTYSPSFTVTWEGGDNQAGVWLYDVQVRDGADGEWAYWQRSITSTVGRFGGQHGHSYYFRSRAMDRVGNRGAWPEGYQAHTTLNLASTLHVSVGAYFADENRNSVWDKPIAQTGEITLTGVTARFMDQDGQDVVAPAVDSASWEFTTTVYAGQAYQLRATTADHMRVVSFTWPLGGEAYVVASEALGLWPVTPTYLPLIARSG